MKSSKVGSPQVASPLAKPQQLQNQVEHADAAGALEDAIFASAFYEPTSVLDPHLSSSPAASDPLLLLDVPVFPHSCWDVDPPLSSSPSSDDWDSVTWFLGGGGGGGGDRDDPALPPSSYKPFHQFLDNHALVSSQATSVLPPFPFSDAFSQVTMDLDKGPCSFDPAAQVLPSAPPTDGSTFDDVHLIQLIRAAQAVEANDLPHASAILARLNQPLATPIGRPVQRVACYFREALQSLLNAHGQQRHTAAEALLSPLDIVHKITAYRDLSDISPVPQFASFTANQAILEALDGSRSVHLIDFDIGLGGQWSSFMHEVAERCHAARASPPSIRMTAVVAEESLETRLSGENLRDFARGLGLEFSIKFLQVGSPGVSALEAIPLRTCDSVAISFSPASLRLFGDTLETVARFLRFIRRVSPRVVVFVDTEPSCRTPPSTYSGLPPAQQQQQPQQSFRRGFTAGLEHYTALLASLDAAAPAIGYGDDQVWRIERLLIRPRVLASVVAALSLGGSPPWKQLFEAAAMKPVPFSEFTESQAEWLTGRAHVNGFKVARRDWSMVLSWQGKDLAATSVWRC
ncbi:hypothetical protein Taro_047999 [Colocasia esculenta]|uniref:Scarecrow-like protein 15 n=1 Tax=Colocasia esculenta TaxID=4460 RepID=A0A843X830_COLES|nr:hypothetical protein [Colocasia esculenta]